MADRYRIGTGTTWTAIANWSATSGGTGGETAPGPGDNVFLDVNSLASLTLPNGGGCLSLNTAGYTRTLTINSSQTYNVYGNLNLTVSTAGTGTLNLTGSTGGNFTISTPASTLTIGVAFINSVSTTYTLLSNLSITGILTLSNSPILQTNGFNVTSAASISINTGSTLSPSTSTITAATMTIAPGTIISGENCNIICNTTFNGGGNTFGKLTINATGVGANPKITGTNTFVIGLTFNSLADTTLTFDTTDQTIGTFTVIGNKNYPVVTATTLCNITASVTVLDLCLFKNINALGTATWDGTSIGGIGNTTGFNFTPPIVNTLSPAGGNWFTTAIWSGNRPPLPQDDVSIHATSTAVLGVTNTNSKEIYIGSLSITTAVTGGNISVNLGAGLLFILNGGYSVGENVFMGTPPYPTFQSLTASTHHISSVSGNRAAVDVIISPTTHPDSVYVVDTNFWVYSMAVSGGKLELSPGCAEFRCEMSFRSDGAVSRTIDLGSSNVRIGTLGTGGAWVVSGTNVILSAQNSTITYEYAAAGSISFGGNSLSYGTLNLAGTSSPTFNITGSNSFKTLTSNRPGGYDLVFANGSTTTVENFLIRGSYLNPVVVNANSTTATLVKSGGGVVSTNYLDISRLSATPALTWYAGANSRNIGANTGWIFNFPPGASPTTGFLFMGGGF